MRLLICTLLSVQLLFSPAVEAKSHRSNHNAAQAVSPLPTFRGIATWYGKEHQGRRTANGQLFDRNADTAAHRTLPFGTRLLVTNLETQESTIVTVTDRGPVTRSRILDLAEAPAKRIGCTGICKVEITVLPPVEAP